MQQKNYYQILQVGTNCNADAIKKAYRKLALELHPDVNKTDETAAQKFTIIKEAYDVLSNPEKRSKFHEAFFFTSLEQLPNSVQELLIKTKDLEVYINNSNVFKIDYVLIELQLQNILTQNQDLIKNSTNTIDKEQLAKSIFSIFEVLPYNALLQFNVFIETLFSNYNQHYLLLLKRKKQAQLWEKYAAVFAVLITIGLCIMIATLA